jgi:hypothetical protein
LPPKSHCDFLKDNRMNHWESGKDQHLQNSRYDRKSCKS